MAQLPPDYLLGNTFLHTLVSTKFNTVKEISMSILSLVMANFDEKDTFG
jgi:hypothetical protein